MINIFYTGINMPILEVKILEGRTIEQKKQMVEGLSNVLVKTIHASPNEIRIHIVEMPKSSYAIAGQLLSEK